MWHWAAGLVAVVAALVAFRYASRPDDPIARENRLESVPFTSYTGREAAPTFSPDGAQVAFTWDGESQDNPDIYVKAIAAEQPLRLTSDRARDGSPAWSPDGTRIAFARGGDQDDGLPLHICTVALADGSTSQVTGGKIQDLMPSWQPL
jgi:Tol biopolymer transport system component